MNGDSTPGAGLLAIPEIEELRASLVGHELPGGTFSVAPHERWLSHEAMKSPALAEPELHPVWILLGCLRGMGVSIDELVALAGMEPDSGVLFGETEVDQRLPLRAGIDYRVRGGIVDIERRHGRKAGIFDVMTFAMEILDPSGEVVAANSQSFILMRGVGGER